MRRVFRRRNISVLEIAVLIIRLAALVTAVISRASPIDLSAAGIEVMEPDLGTNFLHISIRCMFKEKC